MYKPDIIKVESQAKELIKKNPHLELVDAFSRQLKELFIIRNPQYARQNKALLFESSLYKEFSEKNKKMYVYIYYPWNGKVVKCIKAEEYFILKTNRNINLISTNDQRIFQKYSVAVFGMSVGSNIAYVLTQAGISQNIIIADTDELDTTNLNRIWGGVHQIGLNKSVIAARKIYEDNPFAEVTTLKDGINKQILESLLKDKKINCIVEEVDDMEVKLNVRELAQKYKVPVIMIADNGDGVTLIVERYDLGYAKILENTLDYWRERVANCKSPKDFADIVINDMVGGKDNVDPRMMDSVEMLFDGKLVSWPQLGSAALLAGVVATVVIKDIIRGIDTRLFRRENIRVY